MYACLECMDGCLLACLAVGKSGAWQRAENESDALVLWAWRGIDIELPPLPMFQTDSFFPFSNITSILSFATTIPQEQLV